MNVIWRGKRRAARIEVSDDVSNGNSGYSQPLLSFVLIGLGTASDNTGQQLALTSIQSTLRPLNERRSFYHPCPFHVRR